MAEKQPPYSETGREASLAKADLLPAAFCDTKFGTLNLWHSKGSPFVFSITRTFLFLPVLPFHYASEKTFGKDSFKTVM